MNKKLKVLWFCNAVFSNMKSETTGSWLHPMSESLIKTGEIELFNITHGRGNKTTQQNHVGISQWLLPLHSLKRNGFPNTKAIKEIQQIVDSINPDIIHIWGTETYWGLLYSRGFITGNVIIEIQGLKYACVPYFYAGLTLCDIISCFKLKEFIKPSRSLPGLKRAFERWGKFEKEMLLSAKFISTQSEWVRTHVKNINPEAKIISTQIALRNEFLQADKWDIDGRIPYQIFTSASSSSVSYKGLHILFDALVILKKKFPYVMLNIAGSMAIGLRKDGYSKWLERKAKGNDLQKNITWLGSLNAEKIVTQMQKSNVVVVPSFIETYCLALDEALTVGVPTVVSFSGAMSELATHEQTTLFYSPGDIMMCAHAIERLFTDRNLAIRLSENAHFEKSNKDNLRIALLQVSIYQDVLNIVR